MSDDPPMAESSRAGTACALCGTDLSPSEYPDCRAVLVDESGSDGESEVVRMVCADCWNGLERELADPSESRSTRSA